MTTREAGEIRREALPTIQKLVHQIAVFAATGEGQLLANLASTTRDLTEVYILLGGAPVTLGKS